MPIRPRQWVRPWLASVAVLATLVVLTGCASRDQQKANSVEADRVITALQQSGQLPDGVTVNGAYYADTMTDDEEVTVSVHVPEDVNLYAVNELVYRAIWLSDITPLGTITLLERQPAEKFEPDMDPVPGMSSRGTSLSVQAPDSREDADPDAHRTYTALTERWGERPVDG